MKSDAHLREQVIAVLRGHAHMPFSEAVVDFPVKHINTFPPNVGYTFWHLLEHIRLTQQDIIDFITDKHYKEPAWPKDYWPKRSEKATKATFDRTITAIENGLIGMAAIVKDPDIDLSQKVPYGTGQTYLREALMVADHNAYHIGEFAILRQVVGAWPKK